MAYLNNIYGNAAFVGFFAAQFAGRPISSTSATTGKYTAMATAAAAQAVDVDALIAFDALVTTGAGITQLAITTNTIAANEQWRAGLLQALCFAVGFGRQTSDATVAGGQTVQAAAIFAAWTAGLVQLVTP